MLSGHSDVSSSFQSHDQFLRSGCRFWLGIPVLKISLLQGCKRTKRKRYVMKRSLWYFILAAQEFKRCETHFFALAPTLQHLQNTQYYQHSRKHPTLWYRYDTIISLPGLSGGNAEIKVTGNLKHNKTQQQQKTPPTTKKTNKPTSKKSKPAKPVIPWNLRLYLFSLITV